MKFSPVRIDEKPGDEHPDRRQAHVAVRVGAAEGGVERPTGIHSSQRDCGHREQPAAHEDVPTEKVQPGKGEIPGADHHRNQEVPENRGNGRDQEEEDHHDPVHGEHAVVHVRFKQVTRRRQQLQADQQREETAQKEEGGDRDQVEKRDPFVIDGQKPGLQSIAIVDVVQMPRFYQVILGFQSARAHCALRFVPPGVPAPLCPDPAPVAPPGVD